MIRLRLRKKNQHPNGCMHIFMHLNSHRLSRALCIRRTLFYSVQYFTIFCFLFTWLLINHIYSESMHLKIGKNMKEKIFVIGSTELNWTKSPKATMNTFKQVKANWVSSNSFRSQWIFLCALKLQRFYVRSVSVFCSKKWMKFLLKLYLSKVNRSIIKCIFLL